MSESRFDPKTFANYKFRPAESLLKVLKPNQPQNVRTSRRRHPIIDTLKIVLVALVAALLVRTFVAQVFYIPSNSMEPTLNAGDRIITDKISFGLENPLWKASETDSWFSLFQNPLFGKTVPGSRTKYLIRSSRNPKRMDMLVFISTEKPRVNIKRVIGLPGEQIKIRKGKVFINGKPLAEKHPMIGDKSDFGPVKVEKGSYFVLGDNRGASRDSRHWGNLKRENVIGIVFMRIWPLYKIRSFK